MEKSTETDAKLRRRITEAIEASWAPEDGSAVENAANAAMNVVLPDLERLRAELKSLRESRIFWRKFAMKLEAERDECQDERDALQVAIARARAEHTDDGTGACETCSNHDPTGLHDYREPMPCPTLRALDASKERAA